MAELMDYLQRVVDDDASDLFIIAGGPVSQKLDNQLVPIGKERVLPQESKELIAGLYARADRSMDYLGQKDDDFSFSVPGLARFRVNAYQQRGSLAAVVRVVPFSIPDWRELNIPQQVIDLSQVTHGMILVTGTAGSGKSTTQACIIDQINQNRSAHIITLEDPIEYLHRNQKSIVSQREIAIDTEDYLAALRAWDHETIHTAMTAAETGHLLLATLHTKGAKNTIDRIVGSFPSMEQEQIRSQLAMVLHTVVSQQLLPDVKGSMVPAYEIMRMTDAVSNLVRENKTHQLDNAIAGGRKDGMITMDQSILELFQAGQITLETAVTYADNPEQMKRRIGS